MTMKENDKYTNTEYFLKEIDLTLKAICDELSRIRKRLPDSHQGEEL